MADLYEQVRAAYLPSKRGTGCKGCRVWTPERVGLLEFAGWMHYADCTLMGDSAIPERQAAVHRHTGGQERGEVRDGE